MSQRTQIPAYAITQGAEVNSRSFLLIKFTEGQMSPAGYPVGKYQIIENKLTQQEALTLLTKLTGYQRRLP